MKKFTTASRLIIFRMISYALFFLSHQAGLAETSLLISSNGVFCVKDRGVIEPTLFISGSLRIDSAGVFQNKNGRTFLRSIINNGAYFSDSTAEDHFVGNGNDSIFGNMSGVSSLGNVFKENTGNIILATNTDARTLHLQSDGVIKLLSGKVFSLKSSLAGAVTGYSPTRFIDVGNGTGFFKRAISDTIPSCWYVFPLGNGVIGYQQLDFNLRSLGQTGVGVISGTLENTQTGSIAIDTVYSGACNPRALFNCLGSHLWKFSGPNDYDYIARAYGNPCGPNVSRVLRTPSGTDAWTQNISAVVGDVATSLCQYSDWSGIADTIPGGIYRGVTADFATAVGLEQFLPIELATFQAEVIDNSFIRLNWTTALEMNNANFTIMRSTDGFSFDSIGFVLGSGNSTTEKNYFFDDVQAEPNTLYYYQLKQTDYDGHSEISQIVSAKIIREDVPIMVQVFDLMGREVFRKEWAENSSLETLRKGISLPSGLYVMRISPENIRKAIFLVR